MLRVHTYISLIIGVGVTQIILSMGAQIWSNHKGVYMGPNEAIF